LSGRGAEIVPGCYYLTLARSGESPTVHFQITPIEPGDLELHLSFMLAKELTLLQEYRLTLPVVVEVASLVGATP
jgi:hypothetical protein